MASGSRVAPEQAYETANDVPLLAGEHQNIGGRKGQEDRCVCIPDLNKLASRHGVNESVRRAYFAVFDGFGGDPASEWLKGHFHLNLIRHPAFSDDPQTALRETFASTDEELLLAMQAIDDKRKSTSVVRCGSCATVCLIIGNDAYLANLGDSSGVLYRRKAAGGALAEIMTVDHKASLQSERDRIAAAGGTTEQKTERQPGFLCWGAKEIAVGPVRAQPGGLAVSRAFGAGHAKWESLNGLKGGVICEPATRHLALDANALCLVLASDGVWDNVKKFADLHSTLKTAITMAADPRKAARYSAESVVDFSIRRSPNAAGQDNTSAVVIIVGAEAAAAAQLS